MGELSGKVAIVTGASKGIGAAIARRFAEAGAAVAVNYASDKAGADRLVEEIKRHGGKAVAIQANVSKSADVKRLFAETKAKLGAPSILVNNAGVFTFQPLEAVTEEEFHRQFDTNVLGTLLATREAVATFDSAGGSVINLSTIASVNPVPNSVDLFVLEGGGRHDHPRARPRTCAEENPRQRHRAGSDRDRRHEDDGTYDGDREGDGHGHADGPDGSAGRHRARGAVPGLGPVVVADRRAHFRVGRAAIATGALRQRQAAPAQAGAACIPNSSQDGSYSPQTDV